MVIGSPERSVVILLILRGQVWLWEHCAYRKEKSRNTIQMRNLPTANLMYDIGEPEDEENLPTGLAEAGDYIEGQEI